VETGVISNFSLSPAQQSDYFGFKYTGYVEIPADGLYTFYTTSDDGSKLYLGGAEYADRHLLPAGVSVAPGQSVVFSFDLTAPAANGRYDLYFDMVRDGVCWFRNKHNIEHKTGIVTAASETDVDTDGDGDPDVLEEAGGTLYWHPDDDLGAGGITGVTAWATSALTGLGQPAANLVDAQTEEDLKTTDPAKMWSSTGRYGQPYDLNPTIWFDLAGSYEVTELEVWN